MPRNDGTGPFGTGPIGGVCVNRGSQQAATGRGLGRKNFGRGTGRGTGRGQGQGRRGLGMGAGYAAEDSKELLTREKEALKARVAEIDKMLEE
ncbi:MAG: hypothetical protein PWQ12_752 [Clostridiales bacterium]|nr:hypothetical protein [Clostridiales bacterium]